MKFSPILIPASLSFWSEVACAIVKHWRTNLPELIQERDFSSQRVVVPTFAHSHLLVDALRKEFGENFIPPRITTLFAWLEMQAPVLENRRAASAGERVMDLYAELRQHAWLKKLFSARRNTDLLPLAQTLLDLSDELTQQFLPEVTSKNNLIEQRWHQALSQMAAPVQKVLSDEAQLVWTIWQGQLQSNDSNVVRFQRLLAIADAADQALIWIAPTTPDALESAFINRYAKKQNVLPIYLDWRAESLPYPFANAWQALIEDHVDTIPMPFNAAEHRHISLLHADSLEDEAQRCSQTIINWLQQGKQRIAVVAQDRTVARRMRALLERAEIDVADETGWKLSTTRAAAALAAWFDLVVTRADTMTLLDLLKSPFLLANALDGTDDEKSDRIMRIELALRRANVIGGWDAIVNALSTIPAEQRWLQWLAKLASDYGGRKNLSMWADATLRILQSLGMQTTMQTDGAGLQVMQLLQTISRDCKNMPAEFSFAEWRAFMNLQLENAPFTVPRPDQRVVMLPLNGARLRSFDAVIVVGADATHLPSPPQEILFFSDAIKRELGLVTREQRQRQQLRDFTEVLMSNPLIVLSWQGHLNGEHNPISPWISQLQLLLERDGEDLLPTHQVDLPRKSLIEMLTEPPKPSAPALRPNTLSASGYASLIACPYQFFAGRMLHLNALDDLSDMPEKRDYGDWLHAILQQFHEALSQEPSADKRQLLIAISDQMFDQVLQHSPAALGYSVRWKKVIPAYIDWVERHEQEGWRFEIGEVARTKILDWVDGRIELKGRLDRVDINVDGDTAIIDYKTTPLATLKKRLSSGEDHQLAFYALMSDPEPITASYLSLEATKEKIVEATVDDISTCARELKQSIVTVMQSIDQGAALPAQGVESVCQYCDVRGLCRKGAWQ